MLVVVLVALAQGTTEQEAALYDLGAPSPSLTFDAAWKQCWEPRRGDGAMTQPSIAGESAGMAAQAHEQQMRAQGLDEDPTLADYDVNSDEQVESPVQCCGSRRWCRGGGVLQVAGAV